MQRPLVGLVVACFGDLRGEARRLLERQFREQGFQHTIQGAAVAVGTALIVRHSLRRAGDDQNVVLIADFSQGWVKELTFDSDYSALISERMFDAAAAGNTNQLLQDADGTIYQLTFDGKLTRIGPASDMPSV